jgi:cytochrome P450/NADPH-cytochrome P450 reductase
LKNPEEYRKAQAEVDRVVGRGPITVDHVTKLPFIASCIRETLRLMPPVSTISLQIQPSSPLENTMIGGKYLVKKGESIVAVISKLHRDPSVWGDDADSFRPDRVSDENFAKLPPNSWKVC